MKNENVRVASIKDVLTCLKKKQILKAYIQSNFNGSNTYGTMKISSRQG